MANQKLTDLTEATTPLSGTEQVYLVQGGNSRRATAQQLADVPGEWSADTVTQAEAEAGTATTRRAFTAQRVFQAVAAWWAASAAKTKLDGIQAGAEVNVATDLTYDADTREVRSSTGADAVLPLVTTSAAGLQRARGYGSIAYAATVTLDMAALNGQVNSIAMAGDLTLATSNLAVGQEVELRLVGDSSQRVLTFPTDWRFQGTKPANIPANKVARLSLQVFGATNAGVDAVCTVQS